MSGKRPRTAGERSGPPFPALVRRMGLAAVVLATLFACLLSLFPDYCFDIWWHLTTGERIVEMGRIPRTDPYTYTAEGRSWITHEWLAEVLLHAFDRLGGLSLLSIVKAFLAGGAVLLGAIAGILGGTAPRARIPGAALGILLAAPLIGAHALLRPHMLTAFFLGVLLVLLRLDSTTSRRLPLLLLVPLFLVWANVHSGFVLGLGLTGLYWLGEALTSTRAFHPQGRAGRPWRRRAVVLALAIAAALINPNHVHALLYPFQLAGRPEFVEGINELQPAFHPFFRGALFQYALVATGAILVLLIVERRRRVDASLLLPGIAFAAVALRMVRGTTELSILVPALVAAHAGRLGRAQVPALVTSAVVAAIALGGGIAISRWGIPMGSAPNLRLGLGVNQASTPIAAARFLREADPPGRIFNLMSFGGYFIHALHPHQRIYIDGRLDVFPPGFLRSYRKMMETGEGWDEVVDRYGITIAAVDYRDDAGRIQGLRALLRDDPRWECVFFSDNAIVYARRVAGNARLIDEFGCGFDPGMRSLESIDAFAAASAPEEIERTIRAIERMIAIAPGESAPPLVLGRLFDLQGRTAEAASRFRDALRAAPRALQARMLLASALARSGATGEARAQLETARRQHPRDVAPLLALSELDRSAGRPDDALHALERAAAIDPRDHLVHLRLGVLHAESNRLDLARQSFEAARRLNPGDPAIQQNLDLLERLQARTVAP